MASLRAHKSPRDLYEEPATAFVADFIGEMNFLPAELRRYGENVGVTAPDLGLLLDLPKDQVLSQDDRGLLAVRPEFIRLETDDDATATVLESAYIGTNQSVLVQVGGLRLTARTPVNPGRTPVNPGRPLFQSGQRVRVAIEAAHTRVFPAAR